MLIQGSNINMKQPEILILINIDITVAPTLREVSE